MKKSYRKRITRVWYVLVLIIAFGGLMLMLDYGQALSERNTTIINQQSEVLTRVVIRQAAQTAAPAIADSDQQMLEQLVLQLSAEPLLLDVTFYDNEGILITGTPEAMPLDQTLGLNTPLAIASIGLRQVVEPIFHEGSLVGFVRLTLEQDDINEVANNELDNLINTVKGLTLGGMALGLLLAITFGRRRDVHQFQYLLNTNELGTADLDDDELDSDNTRKEDKESEKDKAEVEAESK
uniref:AhpA/YtjB family protein n=1 Tax=Thaumasiovibrio occultus TaxID=1891184 RepID=UPI000B3606EF|nr:AhpA/YtjB family protein [Thaumasiovibrio occultus]